MARVLYITYDGLLEPLGQSQVWQYLRRLANQHSVFLISFEKPSDIADRARMREMCERCSAKRVHWVPLRYHKTPSSLATGFDVAVGTAVAIWLVVRHRLHIIHARSYVPSMMALAVRFLTGARYIFDMRGFWADERLDSGSWKRTGLLYRMAKRFERRFLSQADAIVSLTHAALPRIQVIARDRSTPITLRVIPTCVDTELFRPRKTLVPNFTLGYAGSIGGSYLFDDVMRAFGTLRSLEPNCRFMVVTRQPMHEVLEAADKAGVPRNVIDVYKAEYSEMPGYLAQMDAGIFFYNPTPSRAATAPTRLAEFLAMGIPVWTNAGVGDVREVVENSGSPVGRVVQDFSDDALKRSALSLLALARDPEASVRCRSVAEKKFSIDEGTRLYANLYDELVRRPEAN